MIDEHRQVGVGGEQDADHVRAPLLGALQELDAAHFRHALIGDDHRRIEALDRLERLGPAERVVQRERFPEREAERVQVVLFVVDDQDVEAAPVEITHRTTFSPTLHPYYKNGAAWGSGRRAARGPGAPNVDRGGADPPGLPGAPGPSAQHLDDGGEGARAKLAPARAGGRAPCWTTYSRNFEAGSRRP
jgi:hypothetical protein